MSRSAEHELHHEIFGSILDRTEMTPFLLLNAGQYSTALLQAGKMMKNRGFDVAPDGALHASEAARARGYILQTWGYFFNWLFPFVRDQLGQLSLLGSKNADLYKRNLDGLSRIEKTLNDEDFRSLISEDPRHLFLLASSGKYPAVFEGYKGRQWAISKEWQSCACSILKMAYLSKSIEEDSQDINDYAQLGLFFESKKQPLNDLFNYNWEQPDHIPPNEPARIAFVKISAFFHKLKESISFNTEQNCLVFDSGDGVRVDISAIKARLKSPESLVTKLGKDREGEAYDIRDILAITLILKDKDDTLKLFHALQKKGVILQENTSSVSITQTLFDSPQMMTEAVRRLMISLSQSAQNSAEVSESELLTNAEAFYEALGRNTSRNRHSSKEHRKFQCKISFSLPIHRDGETNRIIVPGTEQYSGRKDIAVTTRQHTLGVELRISDENSWRLSEQKGDSHHDAYKFRQIISVMNRIFRDTFDMPADCILELREDQKRLFQ